MHIPGFVFHPLTEVDLPFLFKWPDRPHLREWWGGETFLADVREQYLPRIAGSGSGRLRRNR